MNYMQRQAHRLATKFVQAVKEHGKDVAKVAAVTGMSMATVEQVFAAGPDLTTLSGAVDFSTTTTAILAVAAAIIVVYIAWKAAGLVIGAVRRL